MSILGLNAHSAHNKIFNARVFNLSKEEDLRMYNFVMRRYGDSLVNSPPNFFFGAKECAVNVYIDWMSDYTYEEEFLEEVPPVEPAMPPGETKKLEDSSAVAKLAARLKAAQLIKPKDEGNA